jgi:hypothetical protein
MKKNILIILTSIFLSYPMNLIGGDFDTPHRFSAGDTISADMMNEIFDYIKNANKMISASDLIGTWSCLLYTTTGECTTANTQLAAGKKWDNGTGDPLYVYNTNTLEMIADNVSGGTTPDGTYSYTTPLPNMFRCADAQHGGLGKWIVKNNSLFMTFSSGGNAGVPGVEAQSMVVKLKKVTNTKILMEYNPTKPVFAECDKQNIPPNNPRNFTASASGMTVSLAWTDNSTDETGFKVLRKDTLTGSFSTVTTTAADATSYSENVTAAGTYKYRVSATNSIGDSTRSKVIPVVVE